MKRLAAVLLLTLLALVTTAPSALAAKPTHERLPIDLVAFMTRAASRSRSARRASSSPSSGSTRTEVCVDSRPTHSSRPP